MEKYGCNILEEIDTRIQELEKITYKLAEESEELKDLKETRRDLIKEMSNVDN